MLNFSYGVILLFVLLINFQLLTLYGILFLLIEAVIIFMIAFSELKVINLLMNTKNQGRLEKY